MVGYILHYKLNHSICWYFLIGEKLEQLQAKWLIVVISSIRLRLCP